MKFLSNSVWRKITAQSLGLILAAAGLGLAAIWSERSGVDVSTVTTDESRPVLNITLEEAAKRQESSEGIFIDARSAADYQKGHIKGAHHIGVSDMDQTLSRQLELFTVNRQVIIYCTGENCDQSELLARKLMRAGFARPMILTVGWAGWKKAGLPVEEGL